MGSISDMLQNKKAHVPQLLKPASLEPVLCNKRSHCDEKPMHHNEEQSPLVRTRESPHAATNMQHSQYINQSINKGIEGEYMSTNYRNAI